MYTTLKLCLQKKHILLKLQIGLIALKGGENIYMKKSRFSKIIISIFIFTFFFSTLYVAENNHHKCDDDDECHICEILQILKPLSSSTTVDSNEIVILSFLNTIIYSIGYFIYLKNKKEETPIFKHDIMID